MADSGNVIGQFKDEIEQVSGEVAQDVKDSVGEAIEQGVQSVIGTTLTPQQIQQKQMEEQKQLAEARRKIEWYKRIDQEQKLIRQKEQQEKMQKQQEETQQKQVQEIQKVQKKQKIPEEVRARAMAELKAGRGVGG